MITHVVYECGQDFFQYVTIHALDQQTDGQTAFSMAIPYIALR